MPLSKSALSGDEPQSRQAEKPAASRQAEKQLEADMTPSAYARKIAGEPPDPLKASDEEIVEYAEKVAAAKAKQRWGEPG